MNSCWGLTARPLFESLAPRPGPTKQLVGSSWDTSGQTTNRVGTKPRLSAERQPKDFLTPQLPLDTSLDTALLTRGSRPRSTHQGADTRSKKTVISEPVELSLQTWVRTYPGTSWSLTLGWQEESVLLRHIGHPLQRANSPRSRNVTNLLHT